MPSTAATLVVPISAAPAVPTFRENGVDFVRFGWLGVCAAKGTPEPVVTSRSRALAPRATARYVAADNATGSRDKRIPDAEVLRAATLEDHPGIFNVGGSGVLLR